MSDSVNITAYLEQWYSNIINQIMINDVAPVMKDTMRKHINEDVYSYDQQEYERRYGAGGLIDHGNIKLDFDSKRHELILYNTTPPAGKHTSNDPTILSQFIENGTCYGDVPERPYVANTRKELLDDGACLEAFKQGLVKRGLAAK